jgi:hypothetical protein
MKATMKASVLLMHGVACAALLAAGGCNREMADASSGMRQTKFPGMVTAGGGTSGDRLGSNNKPVAEGTYAGGTPGIAGGSGGTSGGAATPGTFQESGHGPSEGTSQPSSLGRPGAQLNPGEHSQPATPQPNAAQGGAAVQRETPAPAAPGR